MFCSITRYRSIHVTGAAKFAETIGVLAACRKKSDGVVCSRGPNWQPRSAHAPLAISILIKVADSFSVVCAATSYGFLVNC